MNIVKSEFALALNQVATERGISPDDVIASIEIAILAAYRKELGKAPLAEGEDDGIRIKVNRDTGEAHVFDKDEKDVTPPGFGRIAAQTAKQVTLQKIREVEKKTVISQYKSQIGTIIKGRVIRYDGYNAYVDVGRIEAVLPKDEQIRNEKYTVNTSLVFYLKEIAEDKFGNSRIIVSRTVPELLIELFKKEVPEIANNTVEIRKVAREPGERAKIAVFSSQGGVDPVGACVGQKGIRVQTVTTELGGNEKIDIIQWNDDEKLFLTSVLSPAKIIQVEIDKETHKAKITVDETQAPLAIGKNGVNVNLASKLTGFEIDIVQVPASEEAKAEAAKKEAAKAAREKPAEELAKEKAEPQPTPEVTETKQEAAPTPTQQPAEHPVAVEPAAQALEKKTEEVKEEPAPTVNEPPTTSKPKPEETKS